MVSNLLMSGWKEEKNGTNLPTTRMDAERLVKISRDNIPAERRSPGRLKRRWSDLIPD